MWMDLAALVAIALAVVATQGLAYLIERLREKKQ